jgi:hypothetical protein
VLLEDDGEAAAVRWMQPSTVTELVEDVGEGKAWSLAKHREREGRQKKLPWNTFIDTNWCYPNIYIKECLYETEMAVQMASRLEEFFEQQAGEHLRSIVKYEQDSSEFVYLRDDIDDRYTNEEIERAVDDSRMESLWTSLYSTLFSGDHGELTCMVKCYENVVEMNFVLADGVGAAVALDADAMSEAHGLVADAREIVVEERQ